MECGSARRTLPAQPTSAGALPAFDLRDYDLEIAGKLDGGSLQLGRGLPLALTATGGLGPREAGA